MSDPSPLISRLDDARQVLRRARASAAMAVDDARNERDRVTAELVLARDSRARRVLLRGRAGVLAPWHVLRTPVASSRHFVDGVAARAGAPRVRAALEHVRYSAAHFRLQPFVVREHDENAGEFIRWIGPVNIRGAVRHALFAHPKSRVAWRVPARAGSIVVADCAFAPEAAKRSPAVITFTLRVAATDGGWSGEVSRTLRPSRRLADRRWRRLRVRVPGDLQGDLIVELRTELAGGSSDSDAWSLWGDPRISMPRPLSQVSTLGAAVIRRDGVIGALRRLGQRGAQDAAMQYQQWIAAHTLSEIDLAALATESATWAGQPRISVIVPVYNTDPALLRACIDSVRRQAYANWELCLCDDASPSEETQRALAAYAGVDPRIRIIRLEKNSHISAASNAALDVASGDFIALLDHDDELPPEALAEVARAINHDPTVDFLYTDEDKRDPAGARIDPYFKPDWSPEHFENFMYTNHLMVLRRAIVDRVGRFRIGFEGAQDFDLALRVIGATDRIRHVPHVLYHWRQIPGSAAADAAAKPWALENARRALAEHVDRQGLDAVVEAGGSPGLFRVRRKVTGTPPVTLIITTDDRSRNVDGRELALLPNLLKSIAAKTSYANYELLIVDNGRLTEPTRRLLESTKHRRVSYQMTTPFNFAHKLNFSARHAQGDYFVILNDDVEVITPDWIESLLEYAQMPQVGAVGAKLFYPDGRLQHVGVVLGVCGVAAHSFHQAPGASPGYYGSTLGPRNYSAVTGACLMTRRQVFEEAGGFDERLAIDFNDIDYCLRLRRAGYRIVFTPYASLIHHESGSHGQRTWNPDEAEYMRRTWGGLLNADPYYNPNLTREFPDYRLGT